jgi:hypothetical protein
MSDDDIWAYLAILASQWLTKGIRGIVFVDIPGGTFHMGDSFDEAYSPQTAFR